MRKEKVLYRTMFCILLAVFFGLVRPVQAQNLKIGGTVDVDFFGAKHKGADSSSDLKLDLLELSVQSELNEHVSANALVKYEYENIPGTDYTLVVDEAYVTLSRLTDQPLTITAGKYYLPFGVFNNRLANDPLTQDAYEINAPGVSFGFAPEELEGLDLSLTVYSCKEAPYANPANPPDDLGNYILNASFTQTEFFTLGVCFDSERGAEERNRTLGASVSAALLEGLTFDAEYIKALKRDEFIGREDSAYSISGAYKVLPPLELVGRFEGYDDGEDVNPDFDPDSLIGVEYRVSAGANYELFEHATLMSELRVTELEDANVSNLKEWILRLHVEF